jgi:Zn finger protein HypA/HybF involved in hydrogenase expression
MDETMLDGNAVAGLLQDAFLVDMTTAMATCLGCGTPSPIGATHVFRGAGYVLRCPSCEGAMVTLAQGDRGLVMGFPGIRMLQMPVARS